MASDSDTERLRNTKQLATSLQTGELTLRDVFADCRSQNKGTRILLIADQFEEAFTSVEDEAVRHRFIDVLLAGFPDPAPGSRCDICLILTLRADFYGHALRHRPLADALQGHVENLGPMNRNELQAAIRRPAESAKVSFELGLVETLLDNVENKPGSLPLLQFALREMWGRQKNRTITRKSYHDIGGVEGALAQRAEKIFEAVTEHDLQMTEAFRRLFTRLVTLGEGQEDTRRVVDRQELGDEVWLLAQRLAGEDNRLVVTNASDVSNAPGSSRETAEVAHETLIRHWDRIVEWINQDRTFQSWLRQIKSNIKQWSTNPSDDGALLRGGMLAQAQDWLTKRGDDLNQEERTYIDASLALRKRIEDEREAARQAEVKRQQELTEAAVKLAEEQNRRREAAVLLANEQGRLAKTAVIGSVVGLVLAVIAGVSGYKFYTAKQQANLERDKARIQLLAIQARRNEAEARSPEQIALGGALALESIQLARKNSWPAEADAIETATSALIQLPLVVLWQGSFVSSMAGLSDGRLASSGSDDKGTIKIWPKDGAGKPTTLSQGSWVRSMAGLSDGRLASGDSGGTIKIWPKDGAGEPTTLSQGSWVSSMAGLSDGRLASGDSGGTIKIWLVDEQKLIAALCLRVGSNLTKKEWAHYIGSDTPWQPSCRDLPRDIHPNWRTPG